MIKNIEMRFNKFGIVFENKITSSDNPLFESFQLHLNNLFENVNNAQKKFIEIILRDFDKLNSDWMGLGKTLGDDFKSDEEFKLEIINEQNDEETNEIHYL